MLLPMEPRGGTFQMQMTSLEETTVSQTKKMKIRRQQHRAYNLDTCTPNSRQAYSRNQQHHVTESPRIIAMLQEQQQLLQEVLNTQEAVQRKQKDFERKLEVVEEHVSKYMKSTDSSSSGGSSTARKCKVTRDLSVRLDHYHVVRSLSGGVVMGGKSCMVSLKFLLGSASAIKPKQKLASQGSCFFHSRKIWLASKDTSKVLIMLLYGYSVSMCFMSVSTLDSHRRKFLQCMTHWKRDSSHLKGREHCMQKKIVHFISTCIRNY